MFGDGFGWQHRGVQHVPQERLHMRRRFEVDVFISVLCVRERMTNEEVGNFFQ